MPGTPYDRRPDKVVRKRINQRAAGYLSAQVETEYERGLAEWAADDEAPFPDRGLIRLRLRSELEVLCAALGSWAAAEPSDLFPSEFAMDYPAFRRRRTQRPDDEDDW